jgi:hypothetical protein
MQLAQQPLLLSLDALQQLPVVAGEYHRGSIA